MAHGVEPVLPFDLTLATFLAPNYEHPLTTAELLSTRARQLERREADLAAIHERVCNSRFASVRQFEKRFEGAPKTHEFRPGDLVLVRNSAAESDILGRKVKPRYFGPMIVARRTRNGAYRLAELDGAVSKLRYAAFRLVPYLARSQTSIPVTRVLDRDDLIGIINDDARDAPEAEAAADGNDELTGDGQILTPRQV